MREFYIQLKSFPGLFSKFVTFMEQARFSEKGGLSVIYNWDADLFQYFYQEAQQVQRAIVRGCGWKWLRKLLRKWFPDKTVFEPRFTAMNYLNIVGFLDSFVNNYQFEVLVTLRPDGEGHCFTVSYQERGRANARPFHYKKAASWEKAHRDGMIECFKLMRQKKVLEER